MKLSVALRAYGNALATSQRSLRPLKRETTAELNSDSGAVRNKGAAVQNDAAVPRR